MRAWLPVSILCLSAAVYFACSPADRSFAKEEDPSGGTAGMGGEQGSNPNDGGAPGQGAPLSLLTEVLPDARFNVEYTAAIEAEGGVSPLTFAVSEGALPSGLSLSESGRLEGKPIQAGLFELTVTVTDGDGETASRQFELSVERKRWLAFVTDEESLGQYLLYLVDVGSAQLPRTLISTDVQVDGDVLHSDYRFSADGSKLAFMVDGTVDAEKDLYVVDTSKATPGEPVQVNTERPVGTFGLTPDGRGIAYTIQVEDEWVLRFVDLSGASPAMPITVGPAGQFQVHWVSNDRLVYSVPTGAENPGSLTRIWDGSAFGEPEPLVHQGTLADINRSDERVLFLNGVTSCAQRGWVFDLANGGEGYLSPADETYKWTTFNRQMTYVAHPDGNGGMFVFPADDSGGEPTGLISPARGCDEVAWSPDGSRAVIPRDDGELVVATIDGSSLEMHSVGGEYPSPPYLGGGNALQYAEADRILFSAGNAIYESRITANVPSDAAIVTELAEDDGAFDMATAPDGSWLFYVAGPGGVSVGLPFAIDLRGDAPGEPRRLLSSTAAARPGGIDRAFEQPGTWSPDSSRLAFTVLDGTTSPARERLFVADMLHQTAFAVAVSAGFCSTGMPVTCPAVLSFRFQP